MRISGRVGCAVRCCPLGFSLRFLVGWGVGFLCGGMLRREGGKDGREDVRDKSRP